MIKITRNSTKENTDKYGSVISYTHSFSVAVGNSLSTFDVIQEINELEWEYSLCRLGVNTLDHLYSEDNFLTFINDCPNLKEFEETVKELYS